MCVEFIIMNARIKWDYYISIKQIKLDLWIVFLFPFLDQISSEVYADTKAEVSQ